MKKKKTTIFLGDLVHTWDKVSVWTFPLNVGYIGAYAQKQIPHELELRIFKRPEEMIDAIKECVPDVVCLAYYVWNTNLNHLVMEVAKSVNLKIFTVGGGPIFTSLNNTEICSKKFFSKQIYCDSFVYNQGEKGFTELIKEFLACGKDVNKLKKKQVAGCLINNFEKEDNVQVGLPIDIIKNLDEIPSPYLTGLMDSFFDGPFGPLLETNRSCPYRCTFCAWGIGNDKLAQYSEERIYDEIEYIGQHCQKSGSLYICDANFGILERDVSISRRIYQSHEKYKFPSQVVVFWNKSRPDRVVNIARELHGLTDIGVSLQSMHEPTLKVIKRKNLSYEKIVNLLGGLREEKNNVFSELILGLPEETKESHIEANKKMVDLGAEIFNYNLHLLPGTEMDTKECREKYFKKTAWRLHDNAYGIYDGKKVFEGQEIVIATPTMSMEDLKSFRFIHFLFQFMWGRKWYYDFLWFNKLGLGIHPVDYIIEVAKACQTDPGAIGEVYKRFSADHKLETFDTPEEVFSFWCSDEPFNRLKIGEYGKLNGYYTYVVVLDHPDAFNDFLYGLSASLAEKLPQHEKEDFLHQCREVLRFTKASWISFTEQFGFVETKEEIFDFDILSWKENNYKNELKEYSQPDKIRYEFFLSETQKEFFTRQLKQYRSHNVNMTLRKMSEYTTADKFLYQVKVQESHLVH